MPVQDGGNSSSVASFGREGSEPIDQEGDLDFFVIVCYGFRGDACARMYRCEQAVQFSEHVGSLNSRSCLPASDYMFLRASVQ